MEQTIGQFASRHVIAVESDSTVLAALKLMSEKRISSIVALADAEPIGILTERDVVFAANWLLGQPDLLIKDVMNKPVMTASEDMTIDQAYQVFCQHNIRHLILLDDQLNMAGIFTQTDLVRSLCDKAFEGFDDIAGLMTPQVLNVSSDVPARYALSLMARRSVSCIVVLDEARPVGIFTERDVVRCIAEGVDLTNSPVGAVMTPSVVTTPLSTDPQASIGMMQEKAIRRLLVVDQEGSVAGILTQTDIGRVLERGHHPLGQMTGASASLHGPM